MGLINLCGGLHDSLAWITEVRLEHRNATKELGIWDFGCCGLFSVPCVAWLLLNTSLCEGFLMDLVEMGLMMPGRKLSPCVAGGGGGSAVKEWQLYDDTKLVHFQTAQETILDLGGEQLLAVRAVNTKAVPSQCSCLPAMGAVLGLVLLFTEHWLQDLQMLEQRLPDGSCHH